MHQKVLGGKKKKKRFQSEQKWRLKKKRGKYEDWTEMMVEFVFLYDSREK